MSVKILREKYNLLVWLEGPYGVFFVVVLFGQILVVFRL